MKSLFENYGFLSSGILNVSPREAFELCEKGAIIVDVREPYLNNFKNFEVPEILFIPNSVVQERLSGSCMCQLKPRETIIRKPDNKH